jgi:hypothetical protein
VTDKKLGRPTDYTPELAEQICDAIATNAMGLTRLSKKYDWFPDKDTIFQWRRKHKDFADRYAKAKQDQVEALVDEIIEISDDSSQDVLINDNGNVVANTEFIQRSRLRIDTRKWLASKLVPKLYGDRVQHAGDADQPIKHEHEMDIETKITLEQIDGRIGQMLGKE